MRLYLPLVLGLAVLSPLTPQSLLAASQADVTLPATDNGLPGAGPIRRYEWFINLWKNRRTQFAKEAESQKGAVVFLGDSITQGFGNDMKGSFPGLKVANRGISGDTTRGMLIRLHQDVLILQPSCVVLLMGTNDLEEGAEPRTTADNVKLIIAELKKHNAEMPIILCNVFPSSATKKRPAAKIKEINSLLAADVKGDAQVTVLDTWTLFANAAGDAQKEEFPDLLHPNDVGYKMWAKALIPVFATHGLLEVDTPEWQPDAGFESLFNGHDLTGWGFRPTTEQMLKSRTNWRKKDPNAPPWPVVTEPSHFDGKTSSPDGRYIAKNGRLVVTMPPEGRRIQQLWTTKEFDKDFTLKLQFRATPNADSGVFIRAPQLQCRDFALAGPYKNLTNYRPQEWNDLLIEVKGNVARCTCNDEVLEEAFKVPDSGPIGLEGDRGQIEYRHLQIKH